MQTLIPSVELYTTRGYLGTELSQAIGMNRNYVKINWKVTQIDKHDSQECLFHFTKTWSLSGGIGLLGKLSGIEKSIGLCCCCFVCFYIPLVA